MPSFQNYLQFLFESYKHFSNRLKNAVCCLNSSFVFTQYENTIRISATEVRWCFYVSDQTLQKIVIALNYGYVRMLHPQRWCHVCRNYLLYVNSILALVVIFVIWHRCVCLYIIGMQVSDVSARHPQNTNHASRRRAHIMVLKSYQSWAGNL